MKLSGEGEYNLDVIKEIKLTESYHGLDQDTKGCQDDSEEPFDNCSTRHYIDSLVNQCGCLPFNIRTSNEVICCTLQNAQYNKC